MRNWLTFGLFSVMLMTVCKAEPTPQPPAARHIAIAYFAALMTGDVAGANAVIGVPFSFDRKQVLTTREEVEKKHQEILAKKGKRKLPEYTVTIPTNAPELDRKDFPVYEVFRINLTGSNEYIDIYVSKGDSPKVIGFSD